MLAFCYPIQVWPRWFAWVLILCSFIHFCILNTVQLTYLRSTTWKLTCFSKFGSRHLDFYLIRTTVLFLMSPCSICATNRCGRACHSFLHNEVLVEHLTSQRHRDLKVDVFICSISHHCDGCFHVSDPTAEEGVPSQAGSSLPTVELPRKRKGDVEERSGTHVHMCSAMLLFKANSLSFYSLLSGVHMLTVLHNSYSSYILNIKWPNICPFNLTGKASTSRWMMTSAGEWPLGFVHTLS